ncbi:MAG: holo-ACP synthase [Deltaproteobacteria bacterium]|nr:holo-ACP synthase [Deltaproteobacteria bacterium]
MIGIGVDVIELSRMAETIERSGELFLKRAFSNDEIQKARLSDNPTNYYASSFAAKEAVFKALTLGWEREVDFREIEVGRGDCGEPLVRLRGDIKARAKAKGCHRVLVSISYETDLAVAMAFVEG